MRTTIALTRLMIWIGIAFLGLVQANGQSGERKGYDAFRLVRTRNIFDPNRVASRPEPTRERSSNTPRSRGLSLTGTMVTDGKSLAFFGGSRGEGGKVLSVGEKVSDFHVKTITPVQVELEKDGKVTTLLVGRQLAVDGGGGSGGDEAPEAPEPEGQPSGKSAPTEGSPAPAPSNDKNEILRRMMERRQQQMSK
jgi:hypothetical protein